MNIDPLRILPPLLLATGLLVSACSDRGVPLKATPAPAPAPAVAAPLSVKSWGPDETRRGQAVNAQADGSAAIWIAVAGVMVDPATKVKFGEQHAAPASVTNDLVTAVVPKAVIDTAGDYPVAIEEPSGRRTTVGTFHVRP